MPVSISDMHLGVFPRIYFAVYSDPSALPHSLSHRHAELCHRRYFQFQGLFTVSPMSLHLLMPFSIGALFTIKLDLAFQGHRSRRHSPSTLCIMYLFCMGTSSRIQLGSCSPELACGRNGEYSSCWRSRNHQIASGWWDWELTELTCSGCKPVNSHHLTT